MKIGILGGGAAGLAAARYSVEYGHETVVFEMSGEIGGTWVYTDATDKDENGLPVHSSMYQNLRTNLPTTCMEYEGFPYGGISRYIHKEEVLDYIKRFAKTYDLEKYIKFYSYIIEVDPVPNTCPNTKWNVKVLNAKTRQIDTYQFDALMVCTGHHTEPRLPEIEGLDTFKGTIIHSHVYRKTDAYKDRRVLLLGNGYSSQDISRMLVNVAKKAVVSHRSKPSHVYVKNVEQRRWVKKIDGNTVTFEDGTKEDYDDIIICTGYKFSYPFLTEKCGISTEDNWVRPLYKHVINIEHPTMAFIGIPFLLCPFVVFGPQAAAFLRTLNGEIKLTKEEMLEDLRKDREYRDGLNMPTRHAHLFGKDQTAYYDTLTSMAKMQRVPPVVAKLHSYVQTDKNLDNLFEIVNENEFVKLT